jgi:flagellar basal-body rod protein FlgB
MDVTAHNIANINTPHYKARKLEFESLLFDKLASSRTDLYSHQMRESGEARLARLTREFASVRPTIFVDNQTETRIDGNNVDIDFENLQMTKHRIHYDFLVQRMAGSFSMLRHAISEGRG